MSESTEFDDVARKFASQARGPCNYEVLLDCDTPMLKTTFAPDALERGKKAINAYRKVLDNAIVECNERQHAEGVSRIECRIKSGNRLNLVANVDIVATPRGSERRSWFWPAF